MGFTIIEAHEIDDIGMPAIVKKVRDVVGNTPVYLSIDIDGEPRNMPSSLSCLELSSDRRVRSP